MYLLLYAGKLPYIFVLQIYCFHELKFCFSVGDHFSLFKTKHGGPNDDVLNRVSNIKRAPLKDKKMEYNNG